MNWFRRNLRVVCLLASAGLLGIACTPPPEEPPVLTVQPADQTVSDGSTATFSANATNANGSAPTYQWLRNGADIAGATSASYTTPAVGVADSGTRYAVRVRGASGGTTNSRDATLTVTPLAPSITTAPINQSVADGSPARFTVVAAGSAQLTYQWSRDGSPISGATAASYELANARLADDGARFSVTVSNAAGQVSSPDALLSVTAALVPARVVVPPASTSVAEGAQATFSVTADGSTPLTFQWRRNGSDIAGANGTSYTTPVVTPADNGAAYSVVVGNAAGSATSAAATLTVLPARPNITQQPLSISVVAGAPAAFNVVATGSGTLAYQWSRDGTPIAGATAAGYTLAAPTLADSGARFSVTVSNAGGSVTSAVATLTVTSAVQAPSITTGPQPQTVAAGQVARFEVVAAGTPPLAYQWQRNGSAIPGATAAAYTTAATVLGDSGATFRVVVSNSAGSVTSAPAVLTVNAAGPTITAQPQDQSVLVGQPATFSVSATASGGTLRYQWRRNGTDIAGATLGSYTVAQSAFADHNAVYSVLVMDGAGSVASNGASLRVTPVAVDRVYWAQDGLVSRNTDGSVWLNWSAPGTRAPVLTWPLELLRDAAGQVRTGFAQVSPGWNHVLAVDQSGRAWAWGGNDFGMLGNGTTFPNEVLVPEPMQAADGSPLSGVRSVHANWTSSYALMIDGTLNGFGYDTGIGDRNAVARRAMPVLRAAGVPLTGVRRVATHPAGSHAMALLDDGTLWAWGGACSIWGCLLGDGSTRFSAYALQIRLADGSALLNPRAFALHVVHSVVVQSNGTVLAWGGNGAGQLGDGTTTPRGVATLVRTATGGVFDDVIDVAIANSYGVDGDGGCTIFVRGDRSVWATGDNRSGCVGDDTTVNRTTPVPVLEEGGAPLTGVIEVFGSWNGIVVAKKADGSFWVWGTVRAGSYAQEIWRTARRLTLFAP